MAFIKKPFRRLSEGAEADTYIDLGELNFEGGGGALGEPVEHLVKVAEVYRYEDIADLTTHVYNGNILLIDYTSLASDDLALKRITAELKSAVRDCGGDLPVRGKNGLLAARGAVKSCPGTDQDRLWPRHRLRPGLPRRLLALIPSDEKVFQPPQPVRDLLGAFVLDAEARDVDEEVFLVPEAVVAHGPKDRLAALLDGHVDAAATRGAILDQDVQRERRLHRAARSGDCDDAALRHPALERGIEAADVGREAFVSGRRSRRLDGQRGHLLPQPPDFVAQFPQLGVQVLRRLRRLSGLRGPHPLHVHTVRHPVA